LYIYVNLETLEESVLTITKIKRRAGKFRRFYKKGLKGHSGRRPDRSFFILLAANSINMEQPLEKRMSQKELSDWLDEKFPQYDPDAKCSWFQLKNLYRMKKSKPFKKMQWGITREDFSIAQKISNKIKEKGKIDQREDIMRAYAISRKELESLTGLILTQNIKNKKTSKKFIFDQTA